MSFVSIIGAGPGHPDYITLKGFKRLQTADVILFDALLDDSFKELFPKKALVIFVGKRCGSHVYSQEKINELLVKYAQEGNSVVRLKGGDPFVFGRGGEEVLALQKNNISFEVIPGLSAVNTVPALAGVPITHRKISNKILITEGHDLTKENTPWKFYAEFDGTLVIYMGSRSIQTIAKRLIKHGAPRDRAIALIENGSYDSQTIQKSTLGKIAKRGLSRKTTGAGLIVIGDVVKFNFSSSEIQSLVEKAS